MDNKKGFAYLVLIIGVVLVGIVGIGYYAFKNEQVKINNNNSANSSSTQDQTVDTSDWKTYRNEEYGFEFKYPNSWILNSSTPYTDLSGGASGLIDIVDWEKLREGIPNCGSSLEKVNVDGKEIVRIQRSCFGQLDSIGYEIESNSKRIGIRFKPSNNKDGSSVKIIDQILSTFKFVE